MWGIGRVLSSVVAVATGALVLAGAGAADNSLTVPFTGEANNDCNGDLVEVQGNMHFEDHSTFTNGTHIQFTINLTDVKGVAIAPPTSVGARYVESETQTGSTNVSSDFVPFEVTNVTSQILTRLGEDGTADDFRFYVRSHMTVNANGVPTASVDDVRIECK
jgi:hypothetical protein